MDEFVKKNCRDPKGHKKNICTRNMDCEKKNCKARHTDLLQFASMKGTSGYKHIIKLEELLLKNRKWI